MRTLATRGCPRAVRRELVPGTGTQAPPAGWRRGCSARPPRPSQGRGRGCTAVEEAWGLRNPWEGRGLGGRRGQVGGAKTQDLCLIERRWRLSYAPGRQGPGHCQGGPRPSVSPSATHRQACRLPAPASSLDRPLSTGEPAPLSAASPSPGVGGAYREGPHCQDGPPGRPIIEKRGLRCLLGKHADGLERVTSSCFREPEFADFRKPVLLSEGHRGPFAKPAPRQPQRVSSCAYGNPVASAYEGTGDGGPRPSPQPLLPARPGLQASCF